MKTNAQYAAFYALSLTVSSCASTPHVAGPSTAGVEAKISQAQSYTAKARTAAQRIEDKAIVIDRYWDTAK
jgi:hypothetical protein